MGDIILTKDACETLSDILAKLEYDKLFVLVDETTRNLCFPLLESVPQIKDASLITIGATDTHKNIDTLCGVWEKLSNEQGSRHSLMINLGGGMVTDLGGFAASTFKRGIPYINIPTTLLSMVDASVGGKTGINFNGLKNEIGVFKKPEYVIIDTSFLRTLDHENICSGYAEMIKHALIKQKDPNALCLESLLGFDLNNVDYNKLSSMIGESIAIKEDVVEKDPFEKNIRKALNLGHTVGHAFESWALKRKPCLHGYAVAWGLMCELYLSFLKAGFPANVMKRVNSFIFSNYGKLQFSKDDYEELHALMMHDKKNTNGVIIFTLLSGIGIILINQTASKEDIYTMFDYYLQV